MNKDTKPNKSYHKDHRARMRERYFQSGFAGFAPHELLECYLYGSIKQKDTNELGHELIERFGSIRGVLEANPEELTALKGIGEETAFSIKLCHEMLRQYAKDPYADQMEFHSISTVGEYFCRQFIGLNRECIYLMLLNNRMNLLECTCVATGTVNGTIMPTRRIVELALGKNAAIAIVAHNHPQGIASPSANDLEASDQLMQLFDTVDVVFLEHLIIAGDRIWPILRNHDRFGRPSHRFEQQTKMTLEQFYDIDPQVWRATPWLEDSAGSSGDI